MITPLEKNRQRKRKWSRFVGQFEGEGGQKVFEEGRANLTDFPLAESAASRPWLCVFIRTIFQEIFQLT